jgi:hypothetical protein
MGVCSVTIFGVQGIAQGIEGRTFMESIVREKIVRTVRPVKIRATPNQLKGAE